MHLLCLTRILKLDRTNMIYSHCNIGLNFCFIKTSFNEPYYLSSLIENIGKDKQNNSIFTLL